MSSPPNDWIIFVFFLCQMPIYCYMCLYSYCVHVVVDLYVFEGHMEESLYNQMGLPRKIKKLLLLT